MLALGEQWGSRKLDLFLAAVLDKSVTIQLGSEVNGARSFPLVAGNDDDAGHSRPAGCKIVARIRLS